MSVLIKGVEMPRSCANCFISAGDCDLWEGFSSKTKKRHPDCPLVEIKSPHGRLIDADELEQDAQERMLICNQNDNQFQKPYEVMRAIALSPTIIQAEEG